MREMKNSGIQWIGELPTKWKIHKIKYNFSIISGNGFPVHMQGQQNGDYPVCKASDISLNNGKVIYSSANYISREQARSFNIIPKNSILFPKIGEAMKKNNRAILGIDACADNNCQGLVPNNISIRYSLYVLSCIDMAWFDNAGTIPCINNLKFSNSFIPYPEFDEQTKIVTFLDFKCAEIDSLAADIQTQIDTLEQYKRSVITEAVTKGLDKNVPMKDSGIPWIPLVPEHWSIYRIADLYEDRNERGNDTLPLLSVSINSGVSDKELSAEEQERVFLRSEDKTKYKRVYPGDITYNMMRAWQGALGAVRVDGMVSPAYVVAKQTGIAEIDSRYIEALLRSPMGIEEMNRYSYGIMDFRKRLYWPQFRIIKICLPDIEEQRRIADYIDKKSQEIDSIIATKNEQLSVLADYKKSLIYEYVTGKKEVPNR